MSTGSVNAFTPTQPTQNATPSASANSLLAFNPCDALMLYNSGSVLVFGALATASDSYEATPAITGGFPIPPSATLLVGCPGVVGIDSAPHNATRPARRRVWRRRGFRDAWTRNGTLRGTEMKPPSKSMSKSLAAGAPGGRSAQPPMVTRPRRMTNADMTLPGEGGVHPGVGACPTGSAKRLGDATGAVFGGQVGRYKDQV
jgi:hypothetical protein